MNRARVGYLTVLILAAAAGRADQLTVQDEQAGALASIDFKSKELTSIDE